MYGHEHRAINAYVAVQSPGRQQRINLFCSHWSPPPSPSNIFQFLALYMTTHQYSFHSISSLAVSWFCTSLDQTRWEKLQRDPLLSYSNSDVLEAAAYLEEDAASEDLLVPLHRTFFFLWRSTSKFPFLAICEFSDIALQFSRKKERKADVDVAIWKAWETVYRQ